MAKRKEEIQRNAEEREEEYFQKYEKFLEDREEEYDVFIFLLLFNVEKMVESVQMNTLKHTSFSEMMKTERHMKFMQQLKKFEEKWEKAKKTRADMFNDREYQTIERLVKKYEDTESKEI
jgi:hypothetical protein